MDKNFLENVKVSMSKHGHALSQRCCRKPSAEFKTEENFRDNIQ